MSFEISNNKCEICEQQANVALNDLNMKLHYSCLYHVDDVYKNNTVNKLQQQKPKWMNNLNLLTFTLVLYTNF